MRRGWLIIAGLVVGLAGIALAGLVIASGRQQEKVTAPLVDSGIVRGSFERFTFEIHPTELKNKKLAQFDPSLPPEEDVVMRGLRILARDAFGLDIDENSQPVVETVGEVNHITFTVDGKKIWFELFRNSHGEVGAVAITRQ